MFNGITGHSLAEGKHLQRRLALAVFRVLMWLPELFVFLDYWYTRRSTYGISVSATLCIAVDVALWTMTLNWDSALGFVIGILTLACAGLVLTGSHPITGFEVVGEVGAFAVDFKVYPQRAVLPEAGPELEGQRIDLLRSPRVSSINDSVSSQASTNLIYCSMQRCSSLSTRNTWRARSERPAAQEKG